MVSHATRRRQQLAANRAQFYLDLASGPFYSVNRPGARVSQGVIQNWWRQGMFADSALLSTKLLKNGTLRVYKKLPHGMCTTHADVVTPDLLGFIKG